LGTLLGTLRAANAKKTPAKLQLIRGDRVKHNISTQAARANLGASSYNA
jgi:hypothetical protein